MLNEIGQSDILALAKIVREETGNQVQEKNFSMLESRIRTRILKLGLKSIEEYWQHFSKNEVAEREVLQSLMTTHYTFFFREYVHFESLAKWLEEEVPRLVARYRSTKTPLRIWSAACSRGQEAYSIAMFLEVHLTRAHDIPYEIWGTDIDTESVSFASNGVYPLKEVNTIPQLYLSNHWRRGTGPVKDFAAIHPRLKTRTHFTTLNLTEPRTWSVPGEFDVVFCRNVFIYFSEADVRSIALNLSKRLSSRGLFVSGVSEPLRFADWTLSSYGPSCYTNYANAESPKLQPAAANESQPYRVLVVDDSVTIQKLMRGIFARDPACREIVTAENGRDAALKLKMGTFDLITLDIHMPEVNGIEFLEKFYNRKSDPPVIMVSSVNRTDLELATKSLQLGAFDYVEKPAMNTIEKSSAEIHNKAHLALKSRRQPSPLQSESQVFDQTIAAKIVVPDASQCLRIVLASTESLARLSHVISGQSNELRSPALLVVWIGNEIPTGIENQMKFWTDRTFTTLRSELQILKPNHIYLTQPEHLAEALKSTRVKTLSLQLLTVARLPIQLDRLSGLTQLLVDEPLYERLDEIARTVGIRVSDVTPATSFASLSAEFFAHLRRVSA